MEPDAPTYPMLLMYTQESAYELDHVRVVELPYAMGFEVKETEQVAGGLVTVSVV